MGTINHRGDFLTSRGFQPGQSSLAQRVVPNPTKRSPTDTIGPPWWHYIVRVAGRFQACSNSRGPMYPREWFSPWFDTVEACYLYAELNQWGL